MSRPVIARAAYFYEAKSSPAYRIRADRSSCYHRDRNAAKRCRQRWEGQLPSKANRWKG